VWGQSYLFYFRGEPDKSKKEEEERKRKKPWEKKTSGCTRLHPTRDVTSKNTWVTLPTCVPLPHTCWGGDIGRAGGRLV